jgi:hypothetical protein
MFFSQFISKSRIGDRPRSEGCKFVEYRDQIPVKCEFSYSYLQIFSKSSSCEKYAEIFLFSLPRLGMFARSWALLSAASWHLEKRPSIVVPFWDQTFEKEVELLPSFCMIFVIAWLFV